jgi:hypothetical protein
VLSGRRLGGDADGLSGGDDGEPVLDAADRPRGARPSCGGPQLLVGRPGEGVDGDGAAGDVVQADAAQGRLTSAALGCSVAAGVLASVVPYAADLVALRFVPARFFSVFMSVHAVLAALVGTIVLRQFLGVHEWIGIAMVVLTNAAAVATSRGADAGSTAGERTSAERSPMAAAGARSAG